MTLVKLLAAIRKTDRARMAVEEAKAAHARADVELAEVVLQVGRRRTHTPAPVCGCGGGGGGG